MSLTEDQINTVSKGIYELLREIDPSPDDLLAIMSHVLANASIGMGDLVSDSDNELNNGQTIKVMIAAMHCEPGEDPFGEDEEASESPIIMLQ